MSDDPSPSDDGQHRPDVPGYRLGGLIHRDRVRRVFHAVGDDGEPAVITLHNRPVPTDRELATHRHAFTIAARLDDAPHVVDHLAIVPTGDDIALVTAVVPLARLLRDRLGAPIAPRDSALLGASIARALAEVHDAGLLHGGLTPESVLIDPDGEAHLLDLTRATDVEAIRAATFNDDLDDLRYTTPEQTGRTNRTVDQRSDLYRLGVTIFEMLVGHAPFRDGSVRALMHAHIARNPPRVDQVRPGTPELLADLVERLLAKDPERRYSTARAVAADLSGIAEALERGETPSFPLGVQDIGSRLRLSQALFGRGPEIEILRRSYHDAASGGRSVVFVSGFSGVGKSRLVSELQRPIAAADGWYVTGKFDLYRRDLPYAPWISAAGELVGQLLTLPADELAELGTELAHELRSAAPALAELLPDLGLVIGPQPPPAAIDPGEAQRRLEEGLATLFRFVADAAHPLLVFVDDLQWADAASLHLLELMVGDPAGSHLMIVAAWRDNEVAPGHRAWEFVERWGESAESIELEPLDLTHLTEWLSASLGSASTEVGEFEQFGKLVHGKTAGNPFFTRRLVIDLVASGDLTFDRADGRWSWDTEQIERRGVTEHVAELVSEQLARLTAAARERLGVASCIGRVFDLRSVGAFADDDLAVTIDELAEALRAGVIVPLDDTYEYAHPDAHGINPEYRFLHDRVREVAHDSIDAELASRVHLALAEQRMRGRVVRDDETLDVASHLLAGISTLHEQSDDPVRRQLAAEQLVGGAIRAKQVMATDVAMNFLDGADSLLDDDRWSHAPDLARAIHTEIADLAYIDGRFDAIEPHARAVLAHCTDPLDRMPIHNIRIGIGIAQNQWGDATEYAIEVLRDEFDIDLPLKPGLRQVTTDLAVLRWQLRSHTPDTLTALPPMTDARVEASMSLLMKAATNAYWASPNLVPLIGFTMVRQTLRSGVTGLSAYGYVLYGLVESAAVFDARRGQVFGELAMATIDQTGARDLYGKTALVADGFIRPGVEPMASCVPLLIEAYHQARSAGDIENAAYNAMAAYYTAIVSGEPIDQVSERFAPFVAAVDSSGHAQTIYGTSVWSQAIANLRADHVQPELTGEHIDFEPHLEELLAHEDGAAIPQGVCAAGFLAFLLGDDARAERHLGLLFTYMRSAPGQAFLMPCLGLYAVLLARRSASGSITVTERAKLVGITRLLARRAKTNPADHRPFLDLIGAERSIDRRGAPTRFLDVAASAATSGFGYLEGIALERAAEAHRRRGHDDLARHLSSRAASTWRRYGATARLRVLGHDADTTTRVEGHDSTVDVDTLLETAAAVSQEIEVDQVVARVLDLALENAGASRALLALVRDGRLEVQAVAGSGRTDSSMAVPPSEAEWARIVGEYTVRTGRDLVLGDAAAHPLFDRDPFIRRHNIQSLLCAPLVRAGAVTGLLYLENDLGPDVFTERHLAVARTIVAQAAISIENAALYEHQRRQAEAFARFVPMAFIEQLGHDSVTDVKLGDAVSADIVVLFSDLRDFTTLSEQLTPAESFDLLNRYLAMMEPPIDLNGGFIDKYIGDAVMALFTGGADGALDAALGMTKGLERFNVDYPEHPLRMGIGLHAGTTMLGTIGSPARMETTVIGDTVNTASRLEGLTKSQNAPILVSSAVLERLRDPSRFRFREVGDVEAKGKAQSIRVWELLSG